jgi:hypothetical protein
MGVKLNNQPSNKLNNPYNSHHIVIINRLKHPLVVQQSFNTS